VNAGLLATFTDGRTLIRHWGAKQRFVTLGADLYPMGGHGWADWALTRSDVSQSHNCLQSPWVRSVSAPEVNHVTQAPPDGVWNTLVVNVERTSFPGERKVMYAGMVGVEPGDWADIREVDLFIGIIP
jgi:hypothetical protein